MFDWMAVYCRQAKLMAKANSQGYPGGFSVVFVMMVVTGVWASVPTFIGWSSSNGFG